MERRGPCRDYNVWGWSKETGRVGNGVKTSQHRGKTVENKTWKKQSVPKDPFFNCLSAPASWVSGSPFLELTWMGGEVGLHGPWCLKSEAFPCMILGLRVLEGGVIPEESQLPLPLLYDCVSWSYMSVPVTIVIRPWHFVLWCCSKPLSKCFLCDKGSILPHHHIMPYIYSPNFLELSKHTSNFSFLSCKLSNVPDMKNRHITCQCS